MVASDRIYELEAGTTKDQMISLLREEIGREDH